MVDIIEVTRADVARRRLRAGGLVGARPPVRADAMRRAAWAGLQDSMPRAALLSLHARLDGVTSTALDDLDLVQVWGPRFNVYVVERRDLAVFTLGRLPTAAAARARAEDLAARLRTVLDEGEWARHDELGGAMDLGHPNELRYAAATGTVLLDWDGARQPTVSVGPRPDVDPQEARHELLRRHLHVQGPSTVEAFGRWAGVGRRQARTTVDELGDELATVRTPVGDGLLLATDLDAATGIEDGRDTAGVDVRLLPSGDPHWLLYEDLRALLVPDAGHRDRLWTPRVWPGAVLVDGEVVGTWRRAGADLTVEPWRDLTDAERAAVGDEAASLPLPGLDGPVTTTWAGS